MLSRFLSFLLLSSLIISNEAIAQPLLMEQTSYSDAGDLDRAPYLSKRRIKGKNVKRVISYSEEIVDGKTQFLGIRNAEIYYDTNGNVTSKELYDSRSSTSLSYAFTYDDKQRVIEYRYLAPSGLEWRKYEYSSSNKVIKIQELDKQGSVFRTTTFEYNKNGGVSKWKVLKASGEDISSQYSFDSKGYLISYETPGSKITHKVDPTTGKITSVRDEINDGSSTRKEYVYNYWGGIREVKAYVDEELSGRVYYKFDTRGEAIEKVNENFVQNGSNRRIKRKYISETGHYGMVVRRKVFNEKDQLIRIDRFIYLYYD